MGAGPSHDGRRPGVFPVVQTDTGAQLDWPAAAREASGWYHGTGTRLQLRAGLTRLGLPLCIGACPLEVAQQRVINQVLTNLLCLTLQDTILALKKLGSANQWWQACSLVLAVTVQKTIDTFGNGGNQ